MICESYKVGPFTFSVEFKDADSMCGDLGRIMFSSSTIWLYEGMDQTIEASVLLHELLHVVHWVFDLKDSDTEESFTDRTATGLIQLLADNPHLIDHLKGVLCD